MSLLFPMGGKAQSCVGVPILSQCKIGVPWFEGNSDKLYQMLLGAKGIATRNKNATRVTRGSWPYY